MKSSLVSALLLAVVAWIGTPDLCRSTELPSRGNSTGYQQVTGHGSYKVYDDWVSWNTARERCQQDGGDLLVLETDLEREEVYNRLNPRGNGVWVGVYDPAGNGSWVSVQGQEVPSAWWEPGLPLDDGDFFCAWSREGGLLWNAYCETNWNSICELH